MGRRRKNVLNKRASIFIALVLSVGLLGVGYARWQSGMTIKAMINTGNINPSFMIREDVLDFPDGQLELSLSEDGDILFVNGSVFPDFDKDLLIEIMDEGSIPSAFMGISEGRTSLKGLARGDEGISSLEAETKSHRSRRSMELKDPITSLKLNIRTPEDEESRDNGYSVFSMGAASLEEQIEDLREEIRLYRSIRESYDFEYILNFQQDI